MLPLQEIHGPAQVFGAYVHAEDNGGKIELPEIGESHNPPRYYAHLLELVDPTVDGVSACVTKRCQLVVGVDAVADASHNLSIKFINFSLHCITL